MKILVVTNAGLFPSADKPWGGIFFANLLARLRPRLERLVVVAPTAYIPPPLDRLARFRRRTRRRAVWRGIEVVRPPYLSLTLTRHLWFQARSFLRAAAPVCEALHRGGRFDVVVGYGFGPPAHAAQYVARAIGRPCVAWAIGTDVHTSPRESAENASLLRHNVRHVGLILTESDALRRDLVAACPPATHVHTYYKGIDLADLGAAGDRAALRGRLGLADDRTLMLMAGRVWRPKGAFEFYEAFKRLAGPWPALDALWVGDGLDAANLKALARRDGLAGRVTITGSVPRGRVFDTMRASDLLVFPSHAEGLPNVVMEAMAVGLPVVATDVGGMREVVLPEATGLLVPPRNVEALVAGIERVLRRPEEARAMAARGRRLIRDHFDVDRNASIALKILEHTARGGPADAPLPAAAGVPAGTLPAEQFLAALAEPPPAP